MIARVALLLMAFGLAGCERQATQGELEIAAELRALRLANRSVGGNATAAPVDRELITTALAPMRDVFGQLSTSQRDLSARQATLTQEMRRWTELLVGSMQQKQAEQGRQLGERLAQLEQKIAEQDARHREVEALLQGALDSTADRLEEFLRRVGALQTGGNPPPPSGNAGGERGAQPVAPEKPAGGGGDEERRATTYWLWGSLALLSVFAGIWLLLQGRRHRPVAMAPEMQAAHGAGGSAAAEGGEQEVEELWAAAALLGEAIGRLKQTSGNDEPPEAEPDYELPTVTAPSEPQPAKPVEAPEQAADLDDFFVIDDEDLGATAPPVAPETEAPRMPAPVTPVVVPLAAITCRLSVDDPDGAEAKVRGVLRADPRVLIAPPPRVQAGPGELQVSYALLPDLPAGERSLIEQRLRDSVA